MRSRISNIIIVCKPIVAQRKTAAAALPDVHTSTTHGHFNIV